MTQVRRLLPREPLSYSQSVALHGPARQPRDLLELCAAAGLLGRGGGGFPLARKLQAARDAAGRPVVVVNAAEGEPASWKDAALMAHDPHLVLDGAQAAARMVGASQVVVAVHEAAEQARAAVAERPREVPTRVVALRPGYVRSEASAVVSAITGGTGLPVTRLRPLAQGGPGRRPWVVSNAETLAGLALLARHGLEQHRALGTADEPGTLLLTIRGAVPAPQVVEVPVGTPVRAALACAGGPSEPVGAVLLGGYAGRWLTAPQVLDLPLSRAGAQAAGGTLGAGLLLVLPRSHCGLSATATIVDHLAQQSARQCGPCLNGLPLLAADLRAAAAGAAPPETWERLARRCELVTGRGACAHPDGVVALVRSALTAFADDVDVHRTRSCGRPGHVLDGLPT